MEINTPISESLMFRSVVKTIFLTLLYVIISSVVLNSFMVEWGFRGHNRRFGFEKMIGYSSYKPFVFRILTPTVANLLPDAIKDKIVTKLKSEGVDDIFIYVRITYIIRRIVEVLNNSYISWAGYIQRFCTRLGTIAPPHQFSSRWVHV